MIVYFFLFKQPSQIMIMNAKDLSKSLIDLTVLKPQSFYDFVLNIHIFYDETSKVTSFT